jgi:hypothetical protein
MGFCTIADLEAFLQITIPSGAKTTSAERAITEATAAIRNYCRQQIDLVEDDTITLDCIGGRTLPLLELPVVEVVEVIEDDEALTEDDDYKLGAGGLLYRVGSKWPSGPQIVQVTYSHGYKLADDYTAPAAAELIPDDIVQVCVRAASRAYQAGLRADEVEGVPGVQATGLGDYSVQFGAEASGSGENSLGASAAPILLRSEKAILDKYRV